LLVLLLAVSALPAEAAWLVLKDGTRIEAMGEIESRGASLVFRNRSGALVSLPVEEVDLDASRRSHSQKRTPETVIRATGIAAARAVTLDREVPVVRDADVRHVTVDVPTETPSSSGDDSAEPVRQPVVVSQWGQVLREEGGIKIFGSLQNRSQDAAANIQLTVDALFQSGAPMATASAGLQLRTLLPGQSTAFEAIFEDVQSASRIEFSVQSVALKAGSGEQLDEQAVDSAASN
jgi:hypothetical protein